MSLFNRMIAACPACGATAETEVVSSVNADRRPDLREAILDGSFQAMVCTECAVGFRLPPRFTYMDFARGQWLLAHPSEDLAQWADYEAETTQVFEATFGAAAPRSARAVGEGMQPRVVFGWPAVREKLLCQELGLEDVTLELLKVAILRDVQQPPFADTTELRLVDGDDVMLRFAWFDAADETELARLAVPRPVYRGVAADGAAWAGLRAAFQGAAFVDLNRLLV